MALALCAAEGGAQDDPAKIVTRSASGYSVDAYETNVVQVLTEVGQHAGFSVEAPDSFHSPLTLSVQDVPLDQVLTRALRNENYIIVYRGGVQKTAISGEAIDKIFLLSPATAEGARPAAAGGSPLAGPGGAAAGGQQARPVPPPPPAPGDVDPEVLARSARAKARADARRAGLGEGEPPPGAPDGVPPGSIPPDLARMVPSPEDFTPPPLDDDESHDSADVPAVDVPPAPVPDDGDHDGSIPDDY